MIDRQPRTLSAGEKQRLQELAHVVMQMLDLRLALFHHPEHASTTWVKLYDSLDASLSRLDTLAELARWEESPTTPAALAYGKSRVEETELITKVLGQQVAQALADVGQEANF